MCSFYFNVIYKQYFYRVRSVSTPIPKIFRKSTRNPKILYNFIHRILNFALCWEYTNMIVALSN